MRCTVLVYKIVKINALNRKKGNINSATYFEIADDECTVCSLHLLQSWTLLLSSISLAI